MSDLILFDIPDDEQVRKALRNMHINARYAGRPCPHCGVIIEPRESWDHDDLIMSAGGQYLQENCVAAHPTCLYIHEATDEWKAAHPEHAPKE